VGITWALFAALALAVMLTFVKLLGRAVPTTQILAIRQAVIMLAVLPFVLPNISQTLATQRFSHHLLRAVCACVAMVAGYAAIIHLPLSDFMALSFSRVLFLSVLAVLILGEVVSGRRWLATLAGFAGVVLVVGPGADSFSPYALLVLFAAFATALVYVIVRSLTETEAPLTILSYQAGLVGLLVSPLAVMDWVPMSSEDWLLAIAVGVTGLFAQIASIQSLKAAPASLVAPIDYTRIVWALLLGFVLFSELPTLRAALGTALIVLAAWVTFVESRRGNARLSSRS